MRSMEGKRLQGILLKGIGGFYYAQGEDGSVYTLRAQGKLRRDRMKPKVGDRVLFTYGDRLLRLYRMPSSSRAYPKPLAEKAAVYQRMFEELGLIRNENRC